MKMAESFPKGYKTLWEKEKLHIPSSYKVRNKEIHINAWQKYKIWTGFEPGMPGQKANAITTELKRILSKAVIRYCI